MPNVQRPPMLIIRTASAAGSERIAKHLLKAGADRDHVTKSGVSLASAAKSLRASETMC